MVEQSLSLPFTRERGDEGSSYKPGLSSEDNNRAFYAAPQVTQQTEHDDSAQIPTVRRQRCTFQNASESPAHLCPDFVRGGVMMEVDASKAQEPKNTQYPQIWSDKTRQIVW